MTVARATAEQVVQEVKDELDAAREEAKRIHRTEVESFKVQAHTLHPS